MDFLDFEAGELYFDEPIEAAEDRELDLAHVAIDGTGSGDEVAYLRQRLDGLLSQRILILDGAMGTTIQSLDLDEQDFRGERFKDHPRSLAGNNEILTLTRPDVIREIHDGFLASSAGRTPVHADFRFLRHAKRPPQPGDDRRRCQKIL